MGVMVDFLGAAGAGDLVAVMVQMASLVFTGGKGGT